MTAEHIRRLRTNDVLPKRLAKLAALDSPAINSGRSGVVIASNGGRLPAVCFKDGLPVTSLLLNQGRAAGGTWAVR
jgi:hypothetical protein